MALITVETTTCGVRWTGDGREAEKATGLFAVLNELDGPTAIICEPAFFDGLRDVRRYLIEALAEEGHVLAAMTPRGRAVLERAAGSSVRGRGVVRLHAIATRGAAGLSPALRTAGIWDVRDALEVAFAVDRFGDINAAKERALAMVGSFDSLDADARHALGELGDYRWDVALAACRAASVSTGRDDYERFLGLAVGGQGALARSVRGWYAERNTTVEFERESVLTWSSYRRALRTLFHRVQAGRGEARAAAA